MRPLLGLGFGLRVGNKGFPLIAHLYRLGDTRHDKGAEGLLCSRVQLQILGMRMPCVILKCSTMTGSWIISDLQCRTAASLQEHSDKEAGEAGKPSSDAPIVVELEAFELQGRALGGRL